MAQKHFSSELEHWLKTDTHKTIAELDHIFAQRSFAIAALLLMFLPATPLPTGGLTLVFELLTMFLALQMIIGRKSIWLPKRWKNQTIPKVLEDKGLPFLVKRIRTVERFSRPRLKNVVNNRYSSRLFGLLILIFTIGSFVAPPFSGLDTLPALAVVLISLSIIFGDVLLFLASLVVGVVGYILLLAFGAAAIKGTWYLFFR